MSAGRQTGPATWPSFQCWSNAGDYPANHITLQRSRMGDQSRGKLSRAASQSLFISLLSLWGEYRRVILLVLITLTLGTFLVSLPSETRVSLVSGFLAQRGLVILLLFFSLLTLSLVWSVG